MAFISDFACVIELSSQKHLTREDEGLNFQIMHMHSQRYENEFERTLTAQISEHSLCELYIAVAPGTWVIFRQMVNILLL
jgi:hypothetical protein